MPRGAVFGWLWMSETVYGDGPVSTMLQVESTVDESMGKVEYREMLHVNEESDDDGCRSRLDEF